MPKIENNPIMQGVSGLLGNTVVYRRNRRGEIIMANKPRKRRTSSAQQEEIKTRFLSAVKYAKLQMADPVSKAEYQPGPDSKFTSAYAVAVADYLKSPVLKSVDASLYLGVVGDIITVKAIDNFKVVSVRITIFRSDGTLLERGEALLKNNSVEAFEYKATLANPVIAGSKVIVTISDKPGNTVTQEKLL